jgi:hypothetical protein
MRTGSALPSACKLKLTDGQPPYQFEIAEALVRSHS